jgi:hypothetical protein
MDIAEAEAILTELARNGSVIAAELMLRRLEAAPPEPGAVTADPFREADLLYLRNKQRMAEEAATG